MSARSEDSDVELRPRSPKRRRLENSIEDESQGSILRSSFLGSSFLGAPQKGRLARDDYTVGWICALPLEMAAVTAMLDEVYEDLESQLTDDNVYTFGRIGNHNVVIACLPSGVYGTTSAATVASQMLSSFISIRIGLMVGIGGGVPSETADIRLGDVVVSHSNAKCPAVVQYDYGKTVADGSFERTGTLNKPPQLLLNAISKLRADHSLKGGSQIPIILSEVRSKWPSRAVKYTNPGQNEDRLFEADYDHDMSKSDCRGCNKQRLKHRHPRDNSEPQIHYGPIASGNQVMKHGGTRDRVAKELGILCFEMEAAGLMDNFPCIIVRGICDYSDSHKNKQWQEYAAATAAAYGKEILSVIPPSATSKLPSEMVVVQDSSSVRRQVIIDSLKFDQVDSRRATIKNAHAKTCKWLLRELEYKDWLNREKTTENHGFLWIKGKPATGKSTIMKFVLTREQMHKGTVCISFFFNARGGHLEKSTIGMYRSLILQLLEAIPELQRVLDSYQSTLTTHGEGFHWNVEKLQDLFHLIIRSLGQERLMCFVDALDECAEDEIRDMVEYFEDLADSFIASSIRLHICFSSRHYPYITIRRGLQLVLENQEGHARDIVNYLTSELKAGTSKEVERIKQEILDKASGVFLWVVLVVRILNKEYDRGRIHALRKRLREIPTKLGELFKDILTRDNEKISELLLCIQWVLYAKEPISKEELYFAILSHEDPQSLSAWNPDEITSNDIERFILSSSKGLAETTKGDNPTVQFIHESVRDFFLKENGLADLWPDPTDNFEGSSHERLRICCYNYMSLDISKHMPLPAVFPYPSTLPSAQSDDAATLRESLRQLFPFLSYAVYHVLYHSDVAEECGSSQGSFIREFPLSRWIHLNNALEPHQIRRYTSKASLMYVLAELDLPSLIKMHARQDFSLDTREDERHEFPLLAAFKMGKIKALQALVTPNPNMRSSAPQFNLYTEFEHDLARLLELSRDFKGRKAERVRKGQTLLSHAAEQGSAPIVRLLLATNRVDLNTRDNEGRTPLFHATAYGHASVANMLLAATSSDIDLIGRSHFQEALANAATHGLENVVRWLFDYFEGFDINLANSDSRTSFSYATENGHVATVELCLANSQIKPDSLDKDRRTPLSYAAGKGHAAIVEQLLANSQVNPDSRDVMFRTPLSYAAEQGHEAVVKLLLANSRVNPNSMAPGSPFSSVAQKCTPLIYAASAGHMDVVKLLLAHDQVNPDASVRKGTALNHAASNGQDGFVKLLLAHDRVRPNARDNFGRTALSSAVEFGYEAVVKVLLADSRVDANSEDTLRRTPLFNAIFKGGSPAMVRLLLTAARVNPDQEDRDGQTPLCCACIRNNGPIVSSLLATGEVDVDYDGYEERSPLSHAASCGNTTAIRLLLADDRANPDLKERGGFTPIFHAALNGHDEVLRCFADSETHPDSWAKKALTSAADWRHENVIKLFVATNEVNLDFKDGAGRTMLSHAAESGNDKMVQNLLATNQVHPDSSDYLGRTPLSYAAEKGRLKIVLMLLTSNRANPLLADSKNRTPIDWARLCGHVDTAVALSRSSTRSLPMSLSLEESS